jgi:hypothetical protein
MDSKNLIPKKETPKRKDASFTIPPNVSPNVRILARESQKQQQQK